MKKSLIILVALIAAAAFVVLPSRTRNPPAATDTQPPYGTRLAEVVEHPSATTNATAPQTPQYRMRLQTIVQRPVGQTNVTATTDSPVKP